MLFEKRLRDGLMDGSISVAFRRWRRAQVVAGHRYRLGAGAGMVLVSRVDIVEAREITEDSARAAGFGSTTEVLKFLGGPPDEPIFRIAFGGVGDDPRDELRENLDLDGLDKRLQRIAGAREILEAIEAQPGRRAGDLATQLGWKELQPFKLHVRRLKALGLTISLEVGYRLSPRGEAYLAKTRAARPQRRSGRS